MKTKYMIYKNKQKKKINKIKKQKINQNKYNKNINNNNGNQYRKIIQQKIQIKKQEIYNINLNKNFIYIQIKLIQQIMEIISKITVQGMQKIIKKQIKEQIFLNIIQNQQKVQKYQLKQVEMEMLIKLHRASINVVQIIKILLCFILLEMHQLVIQILLRKFMPRKIYAKLVNSQAKNQRKLNQWMRRNLKSLLIGKLMIIFQILKVKVHPSQQDKEVNKVKGKMIKINKENYKEIIKSKVIQQLQIKKYQIMEINQQHANKNKIKLEPRIKKQLREKSQILKFQFQNKNGRKYQLFSIMTVNKNDLYFILHILLKINLFNYIFIKFVKNKQNIQQYSNQYSPSFKNIQTIMKQTSKLYPFLTYNSTTQSLQLHKTMSDNQNNNTQNNDINNKKISFISVIEVKNKDYKAFINLENVNILTYQHQNHGIYITDEIYSEESEKPIKYIILQSNQHKIPQKFQDLFASILLSISNVCIFDISSKYLRSSNFKSIQEINKYFYVMMNTKGSLQCGQLYRVNMQNYMNKLQISNKIGNNSQKQLIKQFINNVKYTYCKQNIEITLKQIIQPRVLWKSYINFQEVQYNFIANLKIQVYLEQNSKQHDKLINKKQKLSIKQMQNLQYTINCYIPSQFSATQHIEILNYVKKSLKSKFRTLNKGYTDKFLLSMRNQYFMQVSSFQELEIKKQLSQRILQEYGISKNYLKLLYGETQQKLNILQKQKVNQIILTKQSKIFQLQTKLYKTQQLLTKTSQMLTIYEDKNMDFKKLNQKYQQKYEQLQNQREITTKNKQYIDNLHIELRNKKQTQQNLHKYIIQILQQKNTQQSIKDNLQSQMKDKQIKISQLMAKIEKLQQKIKYYQYIENKYYKAQQNTKSAKDEMERYKNLLQNLEKHFQSFKKVQIQKFNYILKKNYDRFNKQISESEHKTQLIKNYQGKINKLSSELEQEKLRLKFCQEQATKILQNKQNKLYADNHTYDLQKAERKSLNKCGSQTQFEQKSKVKFNDKYTKYNEGKLNFV